MQQQSLLPQHEHKTLHALEAVGAKEIAAINDDIQKLQDLANPYKCEECYLPFLAYAFKVDFWDESLSVDDKRRLIAASILLHHKKGTIWALERVFEALGMDAKVSEWFNYDGKPYHFKIDIEIAYVTKTISKELIASLRSFVEIYKNVRSILDEVNIRLPVALGKIEVAIGSAMTISFSSEVVFDRLKKSIVLGYGATTNVALSNRDVISQISDVAISTQSGVITTTNLENSNTVDYLSELDCKEIKGGVIDVKLQNNQNYKSEVDVDMKITGGVVWAF